ncbi:MAG: tetratricopeptide repeat protein [Candidatus Dormibacteria bacterium]
MDAQPTLLANSCNEIALLMSEEDWMARAWMNYERAVYGGDSSAMDDGQRELDRVEADLALARGRLMHARFMATQQEEPDELVLLERAADLYLRLGDRRGESESLFWIGTFHQVVRGDIDAAAEPLKRAHQLALKTGDTLTLSEVVRHLAFLEMETGHPEAARALLEESVRLRRDMDWMPGLAAAILALAEFESGQGHRDLAVDLLGQAYAIAEETGAHGVVSWVEQVRTKMRTAPGAP